MVSAPARRELVRHIVSRGLSERRSLSVVGMSASALRYKPACNHNCALKEKIVALAQRHRRYGAGMIYLKLRQAGEIVNHKRVDRCGRQSNPSRPRLAACHRRSTNGVKRAEVAAGVREGVTTNEGPASQGTGA